MRATVCVSACVCEHPCVRVPVCMSMHACVSLCEVVIGLQRTLMLLVTGIGPLDNFKMVFSVMDP